MAIERLVDLNPCLFEEGGERIGDHETSPAQSREESSVSVEGAGFNSPRSLRISMRRSASSRRAWQNRESWTPRSYKASDCSSARSPSSSFLTIDSSSAMAASKSLMDDASLILFSTP